MTFLATGFQQSDQDSGGVLFACLDAIRLHPFFLQVKEESFTLLQVHEEMRVLEIGCGTGADAWKLTEIVGDRGLVTAIDPSISMLQKAQGGTSSGLNRSDGRVSPLFIRMDGRKLAFSDSVFDRVREDRALQHIQNPGNVIAEILRVLKPGGRFVLFEPDWELFTIDAPDSRVTRKILNYWADQFMNGWIGRQLLGICTDYGAIEVKVHPRTLILHDLKTCEQIFGITDTTRRAAETGIISREEAERWMSSLHMAENSGKFFCSFTGYLVQGRKWM